MKIKPVVHALQTVSLAVVLFSNMASAQPGLVAYWPFDSVEGGTYRDMTGHGYDVTGTGTGLTLVNGIKGKALDCSGSSFELLASNSKNNFACSKFTIEMFYCSNIDPATQIQTANNLFCFHYVQSGVRNGFGLDLKDDGRLAFAIATSSGSDWIPATSTTVFKAATWYHIAATYDSANLKVYINGLLEGTASYAGVYPHPNVDAHIGCQKRMDGLIYYRANGRFDEVKFYNYALAPDTIAAHCSSLLPVPVLIPYTPNPTYNHRPQVRWFSNKSITTYRLQIATSQSFGSPFISVPTSDTSYLPTVDLPFGTIWWRVGNDTSSSLWSTSSSISILDTTIPLIIPYSPDPTRNRKPKLLWHPVAGSTAYTIQISTVSGFTTPFISDAVSDTLYQVSSDLPFSIIYWRVKSSLNTQYSIPDTFLVVNDSIPLLIPVVPDTQYNRRPVFKWYHASGAPSYRIQIDTIGNFASPFISTLVTDSVYAPLADLPVGRIYWRVSSSASQSQFSAPDTFLVLINSSVQGIPLIWRTSDQVCIQLFTLNGRMLENSVLTDKSRSSIPFGFKKHQPGVYIYRVIYGAKNVQTRKIMIGR